ncbi:MAG: four helix bundle protein [Phycisphaerales bacterium]
MKELAESRYWMRLFIRRKWLPENRLAPLLAEAHELKRILGSILTKTRPKSP